MSTSAKPKYRTTNWKTYNEALKTGGSLLIWLDRDMSWHDSANGNRGRSLNYSKAAIQLSQTIKGLFNLALRQAMGMAQSLLKLAGLDWQVPDFSTVIRTGEARERRLHRTDTPWRGRLCRQPGQCAGPADSGPRWLYQRAWT